jgi:dipeptidyl aminopeptidase/acylaminoacyl peptidase
LSIALSFLHATASDTTAKKPVGIDFFTKVQSISNLQEKNGNIFFILGKPDKGDNNYDRDLYQLIDGKAVRLTHSGVSDYFLGDNDEIIFRGVRDEKDREKIRKGEKLTVYQMLTKGYAEASEWIRIPYSATQIQWIDKEHFFFTSSYDHHFERLLKENKGNYQDALKKKNEEKSFRILDELPFWSNGGGDVSGRRTHLYYYDNGKATLLSDTLESVSSTELSPDKKTLVYTKRNAFYGKAPRGDNHLIALNTATLQTKELPLLDSASFGGFQFLNDKEILLTINRSQERQNKHENAGIYRLNLETGKLTEIYDGSIYGVGNSLASDIGSAGGRQKITFDKTGVRYITTVVDHAPLIHLTYEKAKVTFLTNGKISVLEYIPYKDGFLAVALVEQQGSEIYFIDKKGDLSPLTAINKPLFDEHKVVKPIEITYKNADGKDLNGYVLPPADYQKGKKYPAILDIHGGPKTTYGVTFFHEMQYWANLGYAVFFTNITGSDGRGSEFADITGKYGVTDYNEIIAFVDATLKQTDFIDENRLGVTGGSYGGFLTNWIIGQTDRFKAAASQRSIASWLSFSNTSDIGHTFTQSHIGANAWTNNDLLWEKSPLKYADKVKTPTLFLHSEDDYRCPLPEGLQMYYALQYFEIPTRMIIFKDENHNLSRSGKPSNRIKRLEEITKWFDKWLKSVT